jgi:hypothetical protein
MTQGDTVIKAPPFGPSEARAATGARRFVRLDAPFQMHRGGLLPRLDIAYETWGELERQRGQRRAAVHGLSPSAHAASSPADPAPGWWEEMVGPGRPIDTRRWFVICVNSLGSCFGTTGSGLRSIRAPASPTGSLPGADHRGHRRRRPRGGAPPGHPQAAHGHRSLARRHDALAFCTCSRT